MAKESRKDQIRSIAQTMFNERGFAATSMRDLAKEVGVEPASLYNHIKNKEEILQEICFSIAEQFFTAMEALHAYPSPAVKLQEAIRLHIHVIVNNLSASSVFFNEWKFLSEPYLTDFKRMRKSYENTFRNILKEGIQDGSFRELDVRLTTFTILSSLNATYDLTKSKNKNIADDTAKKIGYIILNGIKK